MLRSKYVEKKGKMSINIDRGQRWITRSKHENPVRRIILSRVHSSQTLSLVLSQYNISGQHSTQSNLFPVTYRILLLLCLIDPSE